MLVRRTKYVSTSFFGSFECCAVVECQLSLSQGLCDAAELSVISDIELMEYVPRFLESMPMLHPFLECC